MPLIKKHIRFFLLVISVLLVLHYADVSCPVMLIFGKPCPTCGVTRAMLSLLCGDYQGYLSFQPMAVPLLFAVVLCLHLKAMPVKYRLSSAICIGVILLLNTSLYISRIC